MDSTFNQDPSSQGRGRVFGTRTDPGEELASLGFKVYHWSTCPECGAMSEVIDRSVVKSTDGPVEVIRMVCVFGHQFFCDVEVMRREQERVLGES